MKGWGRGQLDFGGDSSQDSVHGSWVKEFFTGFFYLLLRFLQTTKNKHEIIGGGLNSLSAF